MRKSVAIVLFILGMCAVTTSLIAENVADPNDPLYTDLSLWQSRGLIADLPPLRPYPIQLISRYLTEVEHNGNSADGKRAADYLSQIKGKFSARLTATGEYRLDASRSYRELGVAATAQGSLGPNVSYSARLGADAMSGNGASVLPEYVRPTEDYMYDGSVKQLGTSGLTPRLTMTSQAAFGSDFAYFQAGIMRSSFGPFRGDNIILSPFAPQAGVFSFTWQQGFFTYTQLLEDISATRNDGGGAPSPRKFLALHSLEVTPLPWLTLGALESVVWGDRFEPLYLLPVPTVLFYAQGFYGYPDNSLLGLTAHVKLPGAIDANAVLYVDDGGFNEFAKLDFNAMFVASFQGGLSWTPNLPFLARLSANYLLVTPYTYTHRGADMIPSSRNYQNYTNGGQNMGPSLQPNSDRIELTALIRPTSFTDITLFGRFIRHGNPSEGLTGMPAGSNGTIFDPGYTTGGAATFTAGYQLPAGITRYNRFLTQPVLEQTIQAGFTASARFKTPFGQFKGNLSYTFEHSENAIVGWGNGYPSAGSSNGNPVAGQSRTNNYLGISIDIRYP